jgi:hypothetical protein
MRLMLSTMAVCLLLGSALRAGAETDQFRASLSLTNRSGDAGNATDYAWSLGAAWSDQWGHHGASLTLQSDYSRADSGATYDRLKTWWRYNLQQVSPNRWTPLVVLSTEGPHGCDQLQTLAALGARHNISGGFVELSAGLSKDVRTAASWAGDVGGLVSFARRWGKVAWTMQPQGNLGALGEARLRADRFVYTVDTTLDYRFSERLGATYRLQWGNSLLDARRIQFVGLTYQR